MYQQDESDPLPPSILSSEYAQLLAQLNDNSNGQTTATEKSTIVAPSYRVTTFTPPPLSSSTMVGPATANNTTVIMLIIAVVIAWHLMQD
jgi:hypothetical protein